MSVGRALLVENDVRMACTSLESHGTWMAQINAGLRHPIYNQSTRGLKMTVIVCHPLADASVRTMCGSIADLCVRTCRDAGLEVIRIDVGDQRPFRKDDAEPVRVHDDDTQRFSVDISDCGGEEDIAVMSRGRKQGQIAAGADFIRRNIMESKSLIFVHPRFWGDVPGTMKTVIDRTFLPGDAFSLFDSPPDWVATCVGMAPGCCPVPGSLGYMLHGLWRDKKALVFETSGGPAAGAVLTGHASSTLGTTLKLCGVKVKRVEIGGCYQQHFKPERTLARLQSQMNEAAKLLKAEGDRFEKHRLRDRRDGEARLLSD
eukprot:Polyplicarium_translucidae@DN3329_c1_g2_i12.p2